MRKDDVRAPGAPMQPPKVGDDAWFEELVAEVDQRRRQGDSETPSLAEIDEFLAALDTLHWGDE